VSAAKPTTISPIVSGSLSGAYPYGVTRPPGTQRTGPTFNWDWLQDLNKRPDPSTVVPGGVPTNTPPAVPGQGGIRR